METRKLGATGLEVSVVGLGCNNFGGRLDLDTSRLVVNRALDDGITLFDTADVYGGEGRSESLLGEVLGPRRNHIVLATKFGLPMAAGAGASPQYIKSAIAASLRRLRTDYIDLYQLHRPDPATPIEDTLSALGELVKEGKVRYIGCSNLSASQVEAAINISTTLGLPAFVSAQDEYNLLMRQAERELFPTLETHGLGFLPYYPLASGFLSGKYRRSAPLPEGTRLTIKPGAGDRFMTERNWEVVENLHAYAQAHDRTLLELAFAWLLSHPVLASVISGASSPEQVETNVVAARWRLSDSERSEVASIAAMASD